MDINIPRKRDGKCVHWGQLSTDSESENVHQNMHSYRTIRQASDVLVAQDEEISALRDQLRAFQSLEAETAEILQDLETVCKRSQGLERRMQQHQDQSRAEASLYHQLRDALERNQQWQAYEHQREGHVKGLLARVSWLEEKLNRANEDLSHHKRAHSDEIRRKVQEMQEHYDKLLHNGNIQRDQLREQVSSAQQHMTDAQQRCEAAQRQVEELEQRAEAERLQHRKSVQEERRRWGLKEEQLRAELQKLRAELQEERAQAQELRTLAQELRDKTQELEEERRHWGLREEQLREEAQELRVESREVRAKTQELRVESQELRAKTQELQEERRHWGLREEQLRAEVQELQRSLELEARRAAQLRDEAQEEKCARSQELQEERRCWGRKEEKLRAEARELRVKSQELHSSLELEACRDAQLRNEAQDERRRWGLREEQLRAEAQELRIESQQLHSSLELEARRAAQLTQQVNVLQTSLVNHEEDKRRITVLEKQLEMSSKTIEDERRECQCLQKQLHKVLKNLQRSEQHVTHRSQKERQGATASGPDEASLHRPNPSMRSAPSSSLSPRRPDLLDETLLECPGCLALYPASQHTELLAHIERCVD